MRFLKQQNKKKAYRMKYIGLDAHKDIIVASVISDKGKNIKNMKKRV